MEAYGVFLCLQLLRVSCIVGRDVHNVETVGLAVLWVERYITTYLFCKN